MIITKLLGGLGNQMFQYAYGRNIALKNSCELKLDLSYYDGQEHRRYCLNHFAIAASIATQAEIDELKQKHFSKANRLKRKLFNTKPYYIHEKNLEFDPRNLKTQKDAYVDGYWQSEKYFTDSANQIRADFQINSTPNLANETALAFIGSCNSVSLHIRRGDFATDKVLNKLHGICSANYYQKAVELIAGKVSDPVFIVFSDEIEWAKKSLRLGYKTEFININDGLNAHEDLRLMSSCRHHILANSSFSWWGAWLNQRIDKIVISPKTWFADTVLNAFSSSIIPKDWIRI